MTQTVKTDLPRRQNWISRVEALVQQISGWCQSQGWPVEVHHKAISEEALGEYQLPALRITAPGGTLHLNPIGLHVIGADGRVDLEAFPTLSRVKLTGRNGVWRIMTDSNVPLREPWSEQTFVQLAADLLA